MISLVQICVILLFGFLTNFPMVCYGQNYDGSSNTNQQPVGAYRVYQKTNFQCVGRPAGYYADIETGCQVYHMCDGLGRQFSYSCPNTTLFQQRMLICDHWYMVNCSRAESNYAANLLIGQRDKPFVTEDENELRTPRPDLLDRPYAPDYAGESFRNQYKLNPPIQNSIPTADVDYKKQLNRKSSQSLPIVPLQPIAPVAPQQPIGRIEQPYAFSTHWSTHHPTKYHSSTTPLPLLQKNHNFHSVGAGFSSSSSSSALSSIPIPTSFPTFQHHISNIARRRSDQELPQSQQESKITSNHRQHHQQEQQQHQHQHHQQEQQEQIIFDLGVSSSQDSRRSEHESNFENSLKTSDVKTPSAHYATPFVQPIYNSNYTTNQQRTTTSTTATSAIILPSLFKSTSRIIATTPTLSTAHHSAVTPSPIPTTSTEIPLIQFSLTTPTTTSTTTTTTTPVSITYKPFVTVDNNKKSIQRGGTKFSQKEKSKISSESPRILSRIDTIPTTTTTSTPSVGLKRQDSIIPPRPSNNLLPPYTSLHIYDDATTQGPPIYFEWKIPASGLEPPIYDARSINDFVSLTTTSPSTLTGASSSKTLTTTTTAIKTKSPSIRLEPPPQQQQQSAGRTRQYQSTNPPSSLLSRFPTIDQIKKPANGLEPPLFDIPIPNYAVKDHSIRHDGSFSGFSTNAAIQTTTEDPKLKFAHNPFLSAVLSSAISKTASPSSSSVSSSSSSSSGSKFGHSETTHKSPTPRSIPLDSISSTAGNRNDNSDDSDISTNHLKTKDNNYLELKRLLHIPDYTFPLESDAERNIYEKNDSVNSFQIKIPIANDRKDQQTPWYGENAECPECHPSFVKPGTCEPCIKIR